MFAHLHARNGCSDRGVIRAGLFLAVAACFWVPHIDVRRSATEPDENASVSLAAEAIGLFGIGAQNIAAMAGIHSQSGQGAGFEKFTARPIWLGHLHSHS